MSLSQSRGFQVGARVPMRAVTTQSRPSRAKERLQLRRFYVCGLFACLTKTHHEARAGLGWI